MKCTPPKSMNAAALSVVGTPSVHHSRSLRLLAWATLKSERGQSVAQRRLQHVQDASRG